jgi:hypothetical protein
MTAFKLWPEPPDTVPFRILGISLDHRPSREYVQHLFRTKVMAAHPDLQPESWASSEAADVQELVWARDVLLQKFPPPLDPAVVADSAWLAVWRANRNKCPVCKDDHDEPLERHKRSRGRWRGYCEPCARNAENARQREIRHFLRATSQVVVSPHGKKLGYTPCGDEGNFFFVPADRRRPASEKPDFGLVSYRKCAGCGATFTPGRADGRYCSGACRQAAYRHRKAGGD